MHYISLFKRKSLARASQPPSTFCVVRVNNTHKSLLCYVVVDTNPIYLNKRYLFQNKICYLDKFISVSQK